MHEVQRLTSTILRDIHEWIKYRRLIESAHVPVEQNDLFKSVRLNEHSSFLSQKTKQLCKA